MDNVPLTDPETVLLYCFSKHGQQTNSEQGETWMFVKFEDFMAEVVPLLEGLNKAKGQAGEQ
jgi:hypothetical protein